MGEMKDATILLNGTFTEALTFARNNKIPFYYEYEDEENKETSITDLRIMIGKVVIWRSTEAGFTALYIDEEKSSETNTPS